MISSEDMLSRIDEINTVSEIPQHQPQPAPPPLQEHEHDKVSLVEQLTTPCTTLLCKMNSLFISRSICHRHNIQKDIYPRINQSQKLTMHNNCR